MNYQYNGHLSEEERIEVVATEIMKQYPEINDREAQKNCGARKGYFYTL